MHFEILVKSTQYLVCTRTCGIRVKMSGTINNNMDCNELNREFRSTERPNVCTQVNTYFSVIQYIGQHKLQKLYVTTTVEENIIFSMFFFFLT